jgi:hypothetical protein
MSLRRGPLPDPGFVMLGLAVIAVLAGGLADVQRSGDAIATETFAVDKGLLDGKRAEAQLLALARGTQGLADQGNANAIAIVAVLAENGINIKPGEAKK